MSGETRRALPHFSGIDVLRGLAVLAVVLHHVHLRFLLNPFDVAALLPKPIARVVFWSGYYGVITFFVISGFLITNLSLRRWQALPRIEARAFYVMRFARIFPCLLALIAVLSILHLAGAADYAPVDLGFAQDKFQQAQAAMAERKYADAANLAEESRADAELARAKARLGAARAQIQGKVQENSRLRRQDEQAAAAEQQQEQQAAPAAASSSPVPTQDMPAPDPSELSAPSSGAGFQTLPENGQPPASSSSTQEVQP